LQGGLSILVDKTSKVPLYLQLMEQLIQKINEGAYTEHDKLPSERELCDIYELSRITVRQALHELELEGFIYKLHGKGTFVAPKSYNQKLVKLYSFTDEMNKIGKTPNTRVLSFEKITIDERIAGKMGLEVLDDVYKVVRLRLANDEPLMYETSFLPCEAFPGLTKNDLVEKPMYDVFKERYNIVVTRAIEKFTATTIRKGEADFLRALENTPAMLVKRYAYNEDKLIEYTLSVARGDKFNYTVELA